MWPEKVIKKSFKQNQVYYYYTLLLNNQLNFWIRILKIFFLIKFAMYFIGTNYITLMISHPVSVLTRYNNTLGFDFRFKIFITTKTVIVFLILFM